MGVDLSGRRLIVTGASSGIGQAVLQQCARAGARVAGMARRGPHLDRAVSGLAPAAASFVADLSDRASASAGLRAAIDWLGEVDGLVNVAGVNRAAGFLDGTVDQWDEMLAVNLRGALVAAAEVLPHMVRYGRGDIVTIGSASALRDVSGVSSVYAASKAALLAWQRALQPEVAGHGIRIMTLSPGTVRTGFAMGTSDPALRARRSATFARSTMEPSHVADQVVAMLSAPRELVISEMVIRPMESG